MVVWLIHTESRTKFLKLAELFFWRIKVEKKAPVSNYVVYNQDITVITNISLN